MKKNRVLIIITLFLLLTIVLFVYQKGAKLRSASKNSNNLIFSVQKGSIESSISALGQVQSTDTRAITALTGSTVKKIACRENQVVKKGDILFILANESADIDLEKAKLSLSQQQNQMTTLKNQQKDLQVRAPVAGIIRSLSVAIGDSVSPPFGMTGTSALLQLEDTSIMKFTIFASPTDSGKNMKGMMPGNQKINVNFQGVGVKECVVSSANVSSQGSSVTFQVLKPEGLLWGSFYTISIPVMLGMELPITTPVQVLGSTVVMNAKQNGIVTKINVKVGDSVKVGQELVVTTSDTLTNQVQMAELSIKSAQLSVNLHKLQIEKLVVKAPIDGIVYQILFQEGSLIGSSLVKESSASPVPQNLSELMKNQGISANNPTISTNLMSGEIQIATIENQSSRKVSITIDELDIGKIKVDQKAKITLDAFNNKVFLGYVSSLSPIGIIQNGSATFKADILIESAEKMKTGMSATVTILTDSKENILLLPIDAIFIKNERRFVIVETSKGLMEKDIQVGIVNEDFAEILAGLKEGDIVLVPIEGSNLLDKPGNASNHSNPFNQP